MSTQRTVDSTTVAVGESALKLDVDIVGVLNLSDVKGSRLEESALRLLPETRSVAVIAMEVYPEVLAHSRPEKTMGHASLGDLLARNMEFLSGRATKAAYDIAKASHRQGLKALPLPSAGCPSDTRFLEAVFSYKHAAQAAGLGFIGRSSLLITPQFGPRVRLACCLTEAPLKMDRAIETDSLCQSCNVCITNCPSGALGEPEANEQYAINKFACAYFRNASGGCAECMRLCPANEGS